MTGSFLSRHRTICAVLEEMRERVDALTFRDDTGVVLNLLIDEAKDYAQRMSAKLVEYKKARDVAVDDASRLRFPDTTGQ